MRGSVLERDAPEGLRKLWILGLIGIVLTMLGLVASVQLLAPSQSWVRSALTLADRIGLPRLGLPVSVQLVTTFFALAALFWLIARVLHPGWLRRRYGRCEFGEDALTFTLAETSWPGSPAEAQPDNPPLVVALERRDLEAWVTPWGVRVEPRAGRDLLARWTQPLLVPANEARREDVLAWLAEGAGASSDRSPAA